MGKPLKVFSCSVCKKEYTSRQSLHRHRQYHSDVSFDCKNCSKTFARKDYLKQHSLTCSGKKETVCTVCNKDFPYAWNLQRHMAQSHSVGKQKYDCRKCGKSYERKTFYDIHLAKCCMPKKRNKRKLTPKILNNDHSEFIPSGNEGNEEMFTNQVHSSLNNYLIDSDSTDDFLPTMVDLESIHNSADFTVIQSNEIPSVLATPKSMVSSRFQKNVSNEIFV